MQSKTLWTTSLLLAVVIWSYAAAVRAQHGGSGGPFVAVVNTTELYNSLQMVKDLEARFEKIRGEVQAQAAQRRDKIATMQKELSSGIFAPDSDDFAEREAQAVREQVDSEGWIRLEEQKLRRNHKKYMARIYQYIEQACREIAQSDGLDLVLTDNPLDLSVPDSNALVEQILRKKVIYASPRLDLTARVRDRSNALYHDDGGADKIQLK